MPEVTPFIAASAGALKHLEQNPLVQKALKEGIFKDIWGTEFQTFMGISPDGQDGGEIPDNAVGRNQSFTADVAIYRCVDIRGAAIASVPLKVYDDPDPDKRNEVQHDALGVLAQTNPYGYVAGPGLMRYSLGSRDLHGSFGWRLVSDTGGRLRGPLPREIYWMPPTQYKPVAGRDLTPPQPKLPFAGLKVRDGKTEYVIPADQVVYAPTYNPADPLRGTSKISALRNQLNLRLYGQQSNLWFFRNNQRPDVVITGAFSPTVENVNLMRRIWRAAFGGDRNRGPAFLPSDMRVNLLTMAGKDAEWLGQQHAAREDILASFGVPPPVYGDLSRATYENIRTAYEGFWRSGMIPELDEMAWVLTQQFLWKWPDAQKRQFYFAFDYTQIEALQEDANAVWERTIQMLDRLAQLVERRALLPNQLRVIAQSLFKAAGLPDLPWAGMVPGGNMFYVRFQEVPIIEASVQANIDVQAARAGITDGEQNKPGNGQWVLPKGVPAPQPPQPSLPPSPPPPPAPVTQEVNIRLPRAALEPLRLPESKQPALPEPAAAKAPEAAQSKARLPHDVIRENRLANARDWLARRFKRYFQDQQTVALRTLRSAGKAQQAQPPAVQQQPQQQQPQPTQQPTPQQPQPTTVPPVVVPVAVPIVLPLPAGGLWSASEAREAAAQLVRQAVAMAAEVAYLTAAQDYGLDVAWDYNDAWIAQYLGRRLHLIQRIDDTTRQAVAKALQEGLEQGESISKLTQRVRNVFAAAIDNRADTIARTEAQQAFAFASLAAYRAAGLQKVEIYDGVLYDQTCADLNAQVVTIAEAERLMAEEHPNGARGVAPYIDESNQETTAA